MQFTGGREILVLMTAIRVAVEMFRYLFICMFCGGICSVGSVINCSDIS